jgi:hypothetical protein
MVCEAPQSAVGILPADLTWNCPSSKLTAKNIQQQWHHELVWFQRITMAFLKFDLPAGCRQHFDSTPSTLDALAYRLNLPHLATGSPVSPFGLRRQSVASTALSDNRWRSAVSVRLKSGVALRLPPQSKFVQGVPWHLAK